MLIETKRCPICDWPLADDPKDGCVDGNCSYRPDPRRNPDEYARVQRNRKALAEHQSRRLDPEGGIPGRQ